MDTNRIRYFLSFARTGSITNAAALHHISAAAFSKAMKVFSEEIGYSLIIPNGRGVVLSDRGRELIPALNEIIEKIDGLKTGQSSKNTLSSSSKRLRLATFEVFSTHFFEKAVSSTFQNYECDLLEMVPGKMEIAVADHTVDLALTYIPIPHPELDFIKIAPIEMGIFGIPSDRTSMDICKIPFVVPVTPVEGSPNKVRGLDGWPDHAFPRTIQYRVEMLETALGLCRSGKAFAYLPKFLVRLHNETVKPRFALQEMKLPHGFSKNRDYAYLIKRKSDQEGTEAKKLAAAVRMICTEKK